jgi:ribonuclease HI
MVKIVQINLGKRNLAAVALGKLTYNKKYEIALIQEPHKNKRKIINYDTNGDMYENAGADEIPRACMWIHRDLASAANAILLLEHSDKDCVAVRLSLNQANCRKEIVICSAYFPGSNEVGGNVISGKIENLVGYCRSKNLELLIGCDANAHNVIWGSETDNYRGISLLEFLVNNNLHLLNRGNAPTREVNGSQSVIDITFSTHTISTHIGNWRVLKDVSDSDHNFISMELDTIKTGKVKFRSKKKTDWRGYRATLAKKLTTPMGQILNRNELDYEAESLTRAINEAYHNNCRLIQKNSNSIMKWQSGELLNLRKEVRRLHNISRKLKTEDSWNRWKEKRNEYAMKCKKAAFDCWKKDMEELDKIRDVARIQKLMENRNAMKLGNLIKADGSYTCSHEENNLELLKTHFPDCEIIESEEFDENMENDINHNSEDDSSHINNITTMEKIIWAVNSFSPYKAAGDDGIFPALLQKAIDIIGDRLQTLFRESLRLGFIPKCWRKSLAVFIPKIGKPNYEMAKAYRPISLMSFILKTLEKLLDRDMREHELDVNKLNPKQFAYQQGKGTETALHDITTTIESALKKQGVALAVFIDIEGAFDNTAFDVIEKAALDKGVRPSTISWIKSMLTNRVVKAKTEGSRIRIRPVKGCPQGGCLSPLLWCLVVDSLITELEAEGCHVTAYADDLALVVIDKNAEAACDKMNKIMETVESWCARNQLHVNPAKTTMVRFTRCRATAKTRMKEVKLFNEPIERKDSFKYLGVHLDAKMKMNLHINECVSKSLRSLWAARTMISRTWGLTPQTTSWLYKQVIIPRITYGSIVWWHRAKLKTYAKKLDKIHRLALLMITGATKSTPTLGMSAALEMLPLDIVIETRARECYDRLKLSDAWRACSEPFGHGAIASIVEVGNNDDHCDKCVKTWNFDMKYKTEIRNREEWDHSLKSASEPITWYSDGSKMDRTTGSGIYCEQLQIEKSVRLSDHSTVMQAETLAINMCAQATTLLNLRDRNIFIFSDSQAAIKAIGKYTIYTQTVKECIEQLNILGNCNNLTIAWVPGHSGIPGNEKADELANIGANMDEVSVITPTPETVKTLGHKERGEKLFRDRWNEHTGIKHSKMMMDPFKQSTNQLIKMKRKDLRVTIGILTGHGCLRKFLHKIGKADNPLCPECLEEEEDMKHRLRECPAFAGTRLVMFGNAQPDELFLRNADRKLLLSYAKKTELYGTFFRDQ